MRATQHDARRSARGEQDRSWAAPLPDFTALPRVGEGPRVRMEWETRDTMNSRLWADLQVSGPKAVTTAMLAAHPTAGAEAWMPTAGRLDRRSYGEAAAGAEAVRWPSGGAIGGPGGVGFSHMPGVLERPGLPAAGAWTAGVDSAGPNAARELRGVVKEDIGGRGEDAAGRMMERSFQNQWMSRTDQQRVVGAQLAAAEALRPTVDDFRVSYRGTM
jgi:hypothetical protein